jgi:putative ABC transport system ATP-binding protein
MGEIIRLENLTKTYYLDIIKVEAVRGVSLSVNVGELISIMGPSGSGKSTIMHLIGCLDKPTSGRYFLDGQDVSTLNDDKLAIIRNKKIGFVFQTFNLLPQINVVENVMLPALYDPQASLNEAKEKALNLLERVGLYERRMHLPNQLSGGERQRVAIARALINDPVILLADEPTGNLDSKTGLEIVKLLRSLNESESMTEIIVTHDPSITRFTERIVKIKDGLIESDERNPKMVELISEVEE